MASTSTKPSLSLSVSSAASPSLSASNTPSGRRIASWGSAVSETGSLSGYDDRRMTPLPSPIGSKEWGFFPRFVKRRELA
ncbi:hypothetical protein BCR35DRAFT_47121 [Leucosporidium creatinivorum]|uniref:Uncharacterized protein n=1 Tax=Leucosporidium creatinivorum TaxID=106004 RepID=A0A1Y2BY85_9BASI|nr:hypothetical protein BCR35DRAFT_47121 [Leucosporidium creatinivorum]